MTTAVKPAPVLNKGDHFYKSVVKNRDYKSGGGNAAGDLINARALMKVYMGEYQTNREVLDTLNLNAIPPLFFIVTPGSMTQRFEKIVKRYKTRGGWVEEHYGDQLDTINCDGVTPAYYEPPRGDSDKGGLVVMNPDMANKANSRGRDTGGLILPGGITRRRSEGIVPEGYAWLMRMLDIYRNNGSIYDDRARVTNNPKLVLEYMGDKYVGVFEKLDLKDDAHNNPHNTQYNFSYKVTETHIHRNNVPGNGAQDVDRSKSLDIASSSSIPQSIDITRRFAA